jgi:hypothetical protein
MVGKIICSLFALGVFMGNWVVGSTVMNTYSGKARFMRAFFGLIYLSNNFMRLEVSNWPSPSVDNFL